MLNWTEKDGEHRAEVPGRKGCWFVIYAFGNGCALERYDRENFRVKLLDTICEVGHFQRFCQKYYDTFLAPAPNTIPIAPLPEGGLKAGDIVRFSYIPFGSQSPIAGNELENTYTVKRASNKFSNVYSLAVIVHNEDVTFDKYGLAHTVDRVPLVEFVSRPEPAPIEVEETMAWQERDTWDRQRYEYICKQPGAHPEARYSVQKFISRPIEREFDGFQKTVEQDNSEKGEGTWTAFWYPTGPYVNCEKQLCLPGKFDLAGAKQICGKHLAKSRRSIEVECITNTDWQPPGGYLEGDEVRDLARHEIGTIEFRHECQFRFAAKFSEWTQFVTKKGSVYELGGRPGLVIIELWKRVAPDGTVWLHPEHPERKERIELQ